MAEIKVQKVADPAKKSTLPVFAEMEQVLQRIRARAFELFSARGFAEGHAIEDWLAAEREICWPASELAEQEKSFTLSVALPGFEAGDISVTATAHELIVHAKATSEGRKPEEAKKGGNVCWSEFRSNDVYRLVELPKDIDPQSASAALQNGVLKIVASKSMKTPRVVPISSAAA
jgi:HSP20 family molecular chaperone IbpA